MSSIIFKLTAVVLVSLMFATAESKLSRARQNFYCNSQLNNQIKMEMDAAQIYLSLSSHFAHDSVALKGFSKFFESSYKEELEHANKLMDYITTRGGEVETPSVSKPVNDSKWDTMNVCEIVNIALGLEMAVNDNLLKVHDCGNGEGQSRADPQLQDFLEGNYLNEQVEAAKDLADLLTRIERATSYITADGSKKSSCDGLGLHLIDEELSK